MYLFSETEGGKEKKKGRETSIDCLSHAPNSGDPARNPSMYSDWNRASDLLVHRPVLNPLSHTSQG